MIAPDRDESEKAIEGWKTIAIAMGTSIKTVQRLAVENFDPLPVWSYPGTVIAYPSALREWRARQRIPYRTALILKERLRAAKATPSDAGTG